jgi:glycosyltransferase involved in cell wall biosynthesis
MLNEPINMHNIRFDISLIPHSTTVVWVPNRIGGLGRSFDYTNNGRFLFDELPKVKSKGFVVICGNPSQKITNDEIAGCVPEYVKLVPGALNYDEYKWCTQRADIVVALYDKDTNGGIAVLEAMHHGAMPLMLDINEYSRYFDDLNFPYNPRAKSLDDVAQAFDNLMLWKDEKAMSYIRTAMPNAIKKYSVEESTKQFVKELNERLSAV